MKVERAISAGPRRAIEQTCMAIVGFASGILDERSYPELEQARASMVKLLPLLRFLITTRGLGEPAITLDMPELQVDVLVGYDPAFEENLTVPDTALLGKLSGSDPITITMHSTGEVGSPLADLPAAASTKGIRFELIRVGDAPPVDAPSADADSTRPADDIPVPDMPPRPAPYEDHADHAGDTRPPQHDDPGDGGRQDRADPFASDFDPPSPGPA
jgi:hypothetical protein